MYSRSLHFTKTIKQKNKILANGKLKPLAHLKGQTITSKLKARHYCPNFSKHEQPSQRFTWLQQELVVYPWCLFGFFKVSSEKSCKSFTNFSIVSLLIIKHPWNGDFDSIVEKRSSPNDMKDAQETLFCSQVCKAAFTDTRSIALSAALVSVARGFLNRLTTPSQISLVPDRCIQLLLCPYFKNSCYISLCNFFRNYLFPFFSLNKKLTLLSLRELENGGRGRNIPFPLTAIFNLTSTKSNFIE